MMDGGDHSGSAHAYAEGDAWPALDLRYAYTERHAQDLDVLARFAWLCMSE